LELLPEELRVAADQREEPFCYTNENEKLIKYEGIPEIHLSFFSNARKFGNNFMPRKPRKEPPKVVSILFPH
jgi:hypothetical protein